jgi:hypothetical protein
MPLSTLKIATAVAALVVCALHTGVGASTIYIIRHGEKKSVVGCLDAQGQGRANNLQGVFNGDRFAIPTAIFANFYDDLIDCERCNETVTPTAVKLGLPIDLKHGYNPLLGGNSKAAEAMKSSLKRGGDETVVLASWEHFNIQFLAVDLGVDKSKIPNWASSDYDSVYVLEFDSTQTLTNFTASAQNYNP